MPVSINPVMLSPVTRGEDFSFSIEVIAETPTTINSITCILLNSTDPITITTTLTSINVAGKYISGWDDIFTYVDAGQSDKTQTPISVTGINNLPDSKNLFNLSQDTTDSVIREYSITVNSNEGVQTFSLTQTVNNNLELIRSFMDNYNYNGGEM
jgi:hypothetical protein